MCETGMQRWQLRITLAAVLLSSADRQIGPNMLSYCLGRGLGRCVAVGRVAPNLRIEPAIRVAVGANEHILEKHRLCTEHYKSLTRNRRWRRT